MNRAEQEKGKIQEMLRALATWSESAKASFAGKDHAPSAASKPVDTEEE